MKDKQLIRNKKEMLPGSGLTYHKFKFPTWEILNTFPNPIKSGKVVISSCEVTALCPLTGQPDQYEVVVEYVPNKVCVESKSVKFYFGAYRQYKGFIETLSQKITDDFSKACNPTWLMVTLTMNARGGVVIKSTCNS